jgi:hypothetical protein
MNIKTFLLFIAFSILFFSCSEDSDITIPRNLQEYIDANSNRELDEVIACAANANANKSLSYIFYYPVDGSSEVRYYEANSLDIEKNDFSNYKRIILEETDVFGGKLSQFSRTNSEESWCIVTFLTDGKFHKSNPIRLKNATNPTTWKKEVAIEYPTTLEPKFTWSDFSITDNEIYFQVISDVDDNFISGTYTTDNYFQYYDINNVVLNINTSTPDDLILDDTYNFTLMAVSEDNWVNLVIQKSFDVE